MIQVEGLTKRFGTVRALTGACLQIDSGETVAILGPNGSGKTTLLRLITGLLRPTEGSVLIDGAAPLAVRARIGYLGHETYLYPQLSAKENLAFYGRLYDAPESRATHLLEVVGMSTKAGTLVKALSRGEVQRVAVARALLHDPDYLLLDEPFTGLDESMAEALPTTISRPGRTTLVATHQLERAKVMAVRTVHLANGRLS
ncbi:MAG TPA: heme ABC exporter ATP-binding protein CcmA [Actinomycetota bacterium]|nr:heme ABC exporter ATP-binding protein CcmA [Actinomycetota bacterium]